MCPNQPKKKLAFAEASTHGAEWRRRQRFDTPLAEAIHSRSPGAVTLAADGGTTVRRWLLGQRRRDGRRGVPVDQLLQLLPGLEVSDSLRRYVHSVAGPGVTAPARFAVSEADTAEAAEFDLLPMSNSFLTSLDRCRH